MKCLERGMDWVFKQSGLRFVFTVLILLSFSRESDIRRQNFKEGQVGFINNN
jgi:hypothetical protein